MLPAQRPPSPEIAESPSVTTVGRPDTRPVCRGRRRERQHDRTTQQHHPHGRTHRSSSSVGSGDPPRAGGACQRGRETTAVPPQSGIGTTAAPLRSWNSRVAFFAPPNAALLKSCTRIEPPGARRS